MLKRHYEERSDAAIRNVDTSWIASPAPHDGGIKKISRMDLWVETYTPNFIKRLAGRLVDLLPEKAGNWIRANKSKSIMIFFIVRGLFLRPTMWILYISAFTYFYH